MVADCWQHNNCATHWGYWTAFGYNTLMTTQSEQTLENNLIAQLSGTGCERAMTHEKSVFIEAT